MAADVALTASDGRRDIASKDATMPKGEGKAPTDLPWSVVGPGKWDEHMICGAGGKVIAYLRKQTAFQDDRMDVVNGEFICKAVNELMKREGC